MLVYSGKPLIELLDVEVDVFFGKLPAEPYMLASQGNAPYKSFAARVEDIAEQMFFKTERPVQIIHGETSDTIATYNECGLVLAGELVDV